MSDAICELCSAVAAKTSRKSFPAAFPPPPRLWLRPPRVPPQRSIPFWTKPISTGSLAAWSAAAEHGGLGARVVEHEPEGDLGIGPEDVRSPRVALVEGVHRLQLAAGGDRARAVVEPEVRRAEDRHATADLRRDGARAQSLEQAEVEAVRREERLVRAPVRRAERRLRTGRSGGEHGEDGREATAVPIRALAARVVRDVLDDRLPRLRRVGEGHRRALDALEAAVPALGVSRRHRRVHVDAVAQARARADDGRRDLPDDGGTDDVPVAVGEATTGIGARPEVEDDLRARARSRRRVPDVGPGAHAGGRRRRGRGRRRRRGIRRGRRRADDRGGRRGRIRVAEGVGRGHARAQARADVRGRDEVRGRRDPEDGSAGPARGVAAEPLVRVGHGHGACPRPVRRGEDAADGGAPRQARSVDGGGRPVVGHGRARERADADAWRFGRPGPRG